MSLYTPYRYLFHLKKKRRDKNITPLNVNSMHIAIHTPSRPIVLESHHARGTLTSHILPKFINAGTVVCPTPTNAPYATIDAANIGSAHASMRSTLAPKVLIDSTGVISDIISCAKTYINKPITAITTIPNPTAI